MYLTRIRPKKSQTPNLTNLLVSKVNLTTIGHLQVKHVIQPHLIGQ